MGLGDARDSVAGYGHDHSRRAGGSPDDSRSRQGGRLHGSFEEHLVRRGRLGGVSVSTAQRENEQARHQQNPAALDGCVQAGE